MRIAVAMMSHETNTFSPVLTDLERFSGGQAQPLEGTEAIAVYANTASCLGGYLEVCQSHGADVDLAIAAGAPPSGPVEDDAFEFMCEKIVAASASCDGMLLDLHGAMVTRTYDDGEGELLRRIRSAAPSLPIAVCLDMHANLTEQIAAHANIVTGYQTYPHVDMDRTAVRAANLLFRMLAGEIQPKMVWGNAPMLPHVMRQGTDDEPNLTLQKRAAELEASDTALAVSVFTGFPHADIYDAGLSVVVVSNNDAAAATQVRDELLDIAWGARDDFVYTPTPLGDSLREAQSAAEQPGDGPVLLLDHYDNTASGGTMDTTEVLKAIIDAGLQDVAVCGFYDPQAVQTMIKAGIGNTVTLALGGKLPMPALDVQSQPITLTGTVKLISDGRFPRDGCNVTRTHHEYGYQCRATDSWRH